MLILVKTPQPYCNDPWVFARTTEALQRRPLAARYVSQFLGFGNNTKAGASWPAHDVTHEGSLAKMRGGA